MLGLRMPSSTKGNLTQTEYKLENRAGTCNALCALLHLFYELRVHRPQSTFALDGSSVLLSNMEGGQTAPAKKGMMGMDRAA